MNNYVRAARFAIVVCGSLLIIQGALPHQGLFGASEIREASSALLNDEQSPFRHLNQTEMGVQPESVGGTEESQSVIAKTEEVTVKKGATFSSLWREIGGKAEDLTAALKALKISGVGAGALKQGEQVSVTRGDGEIVEVKKKISSEATAVLSRNERGEYTSRVERVKVVAREKRVTGTIISSLGDSAAGLSLPYSLVDDFVDLFSNRVEFRKDLQPGDTFTIIFDERMTEGGEILEPGSIKAASLQLNGNLLAAVRHVATDGSVRYFDEKGQMPTKSFLRYPVKYSRISSMFTHARFHPVLKVSRPHNGVDFSAPIGTPVRVVGDGAVVFSGYSATTGNMVRVQHDSRYTTEYMHLNSIAKGVRKGARIARGEIIGTVGRTGLASGPHLHYGLFDKGSYVDPMRSKIAQAPEGPVKPPPAVLAMIDDLKKAHRSVAVAAKAGDKKA
jgi:murein DD-endopeptidase MepM/ murein hydrolase activator NlpD